MAKKYDYYTDQGHIELHLLPKTEKLAHHHTRIHVRHVVIGTTLILIGSTMATSAHAVRPDLIPIAVWDGAAYFLHGVGCIPILKHVEGLWVFFSE